MDDDVLGVLVLVVCRAKEGKILVCQKEGWIERNGIIQGVCFPPAAARTAERSRRRTQSSAKVRNRAPWSGW